MAVDATIPVIVVTVALGVGIFVLLVALAMYVRSRQRVQRLRREMVTRKQRRTGKASAGAATSRVSVPDDVVKIVRDRRRRAAVNEMLGKMRGYPGRMYIPNESQAGYNGWEGRAYAGDYNYGERSASPNNYERRIVPPEFRRRVEYEESSESSESDSSSSDDEPRRRRQSHSRRRRNAAPTMPPVIVMPAAQPATTTALVHPSPPAVQPAVQQQVVQPAVPQQVVRPQVVVPPPAPPVQPPPAVMPASTGVVGIQRRGGAVFTANQAGHRGREYEEQQQTADATAGATVAARPVAQQMSPTSVAMVGRTDHSRSATSSTWQAAAVPDGRQMSTTAVAMVGRTDQERGRSQQQHHFNNIEMADFSRRY